MKFIEILKSAGWYEIKEQIHYSKGSWELVFDTSSWIELSTASNPRLFDVPVPEECLAQWTVNLIEHLCKAEDERVRLQTEVERIRT